MMKTFKFIREKMKKELLDNLVGMDVAEAQVLIKSHHHDTYLVPESCTALNLLARPNTIIVFQEEGKVKFAKAGDPCEIEE